MKPARSTRLLLSLLLILVALAPRCTQAAGALTTCTITDLGPLPGDTFSAAYAINASGQVVGTSGTQDASGNVVTYHAVRWDAAATIPTELGASPGITSSVAWGINDSGVVVGAASSTAVEWAPPATATTPITTLGLFPGDTFSAALAINASGQVAGYSATRDASGNMVFHAVRWDAAATAPTELGTSPGITSSVALGINASGAVVGAAGGAVEWAPAATATTPITTLGQLPGQTGSIAFAINASGLVVGEADTKDATGNSITHAVRWDAATTPPTDLGTLSGITSSVALGINASGAVVGAAGTPSPNGDIFGSAVLWNAGMTTPTYLGVLLPSGSPWALLSAYAINDAGQIVGFGTINGAVHGFRLTCT
jgi:probable HAF family extracellular repeat protein